MISQILLTIAILTTTLGQEIYRKEWTSFYPCKGNKDITISFENEQAFDNNFFFYLTVRGSFRDNCIMAIKFLSPEFVQWTYPNLEFRLSNGATLRAVLNAKEKNPVFRIRSSYGASMYIKSLKIDNDERCKNPDTELIDKIRTKGDDTTYKPNKENVDDSSCGKRQSTENQMASLDGTETEPNGWPWHVYIIKGALKKICGGTLISKTAVVTAAHCVSEKGVPLKSLTAILGQQSFSALDEDLQEISVRQVILHPDFSNSSLANDIAVLKLSSEATFSKSVQPACLWHESDYETISSDFKGMVTGWSFPHLYSPSPAMRQAYVSRIKQSECAQNEYDKFINMLNDQKFCVGATKDVTPCIADGGSGFTVLVPNEENGSWHLRGILSSISNVGNSAKCDGTKPAIMTDVALYTPWLREQLN